ncbi:thiolase family protein [uncultured Roseibium sp.]|uniref:thiolase family protein n=1 Tax=uncultured Roseibium sp. TaxID=1936171 RepID=UPI0026174465|nr:thiolase family protein [uncultured Roseibium sp.]
MTQTRKAVIAAARRTAVCPRGGALALLQADELAAPVLAQLVVDAGLEPEEVDCVFLGNALYGGGNPARLAALRAGLPQTVPALTIDTQCCSGLDAIVMGARLIEAGAADIVLAGGAESFSRSPIRMTRPVDPAVPPVAYDRPAFAPAPFGDPDLADAAAKLAAETGTSREDQAVFAVTSHDKARSARDYLRGRLVNAGGKLPEEDGFTRHLSLKTALRAPLLNGDNETGLSAATIACAADGAAAVLLMSEGAFQERFHLNSNESRMTGLKILASRSAGGSPAEPALVPIEVAKAMFAELGMDATKLAATELMEAYAVQAMVTAAHLGLASEGLNRMGGALARGHPIGASGAILAVHLFDLLTRKEAPAEGARNVGMALIAAAGGLGSGIAVSPAVRKGG